MQKRRRILIDPVQKAIVARSFFYWAFSFALIFAVLVCWQVLDDTSASFADAISRTWTAYGRAFLVGSLVMPVFAIDMIRLSHRFAGPIFRLRRELSRMARDEKTAELAFRPGDYWSELAEDFNRIRDRLSSSARAREPSELAADPDSAKLPPSTASAVLDESLELAT